MSGLAAVSGHLARVPHLQVPHLHLHLHLLLHLHMHLHLHFHLHIHNHLHLQVLLAWDPIACRDVGWLTLVSREVVGVAATLGDLGLTLRDYSMEAGGRSELEELIHDIMAVIRDRWGSRLPIAET